MTQIQTIGTKINKRRYRRTPKSKTKITYKPSKKLFEKPAPCQLSENQTLPDFEDYDPLWFVSRKKMFDLDFL